MSNKLILKQKSKYLNSITVFPFFHLIFLLNWNKQEIFKRRRDKDQKQLPQPATLLKIDYAVSVFLWILQKFQEPLL